MARNGKNSFMCHIQPFDGDQELVQFFFTQIAEIAEINTWSDIQTLTFAKSKLTGNALKFYITSEAAQNAANVDDLKTVFLNFFRPKTKNSALLELQALTLLPNESYLNLNQRLDSLIRIVHPEIRDKAALDSVKATHFLNSINPIHKLKILEAAITAYDEIVARAQLLQDVTIQAQVLNPLPSRDSLSHPVLDDLSQQVNFIKEKVENLSGNNSNKQESSHSTSNDTYESNLPNRHRFNKNRQAADFRASNVRCQYCGKGRHTLANCFRFKNFVASQGNQANQASSSRHRPYSNSQNRRYTLNANARTFRPRYRNSNNHTSTNNHQNLNE